MGDARHSQRGSGFPNTSLGFVVRCGPAGARAGTWGRLLTPLGIGGDACSVGLVDANYLPDGEPSNAGRKGYGHGKGNRAARRQSAEGRAKEQWNQEKGSHVNPLVGDTPQDQAQERPGGKTYDPHWKQAVYKEDLQRLVVVALQLRG